MKRVFGSALVSIITLTLLYFSKNSTYALVPIEIKDTIKVDPKILACTVISSSINDKLETFSNSETKHLETYTKILDRLSQMIDKWESWGYDVSEIEADLDYIEELVNEYKEDYNDFVSKLTAAKNACGNTDYNTKLTAAKNALKELRGDVVNIRTFYQTELRPDILALKSQNVR
ncbi:MAG: hypothetical protein KatS3mg101_0182 [Patescibacteria group bacterium]|nr:MAG: hypothetical protein KatS3mg101_0182 [Patescibacteria group bacterium]